jgi:hypothetical protein
MQKAILKLFAFVSALSVRNAKIFIFILVIFFFGILTGAIEAFLYWYLEADLGNKLKILPGLCAMFACLPNPK